MAVIYSYPVKTVNANNDDLIIISDSADGNKTKQIKVSQLPSVSGAGITLTTTGTTGQAQLISTNLNIPQYQGQLTLTTTGTGAATLAGDTLNIPTPVPSSYVLPLATSSARGGVKIGYVQNAKKYPVELLNEQMFVDVPWTDNNTTYTASSGVLLTGTNFTNNDKGSSQNIFKTIAVAGQTSIAADSNADTLTFAAGANITLTTNNLTDTLTIAASGSGGGGALNLLKTSVFGYTGTTQATYSEFPLTNSTSFAAVRFHPTNPLSTPTNDVVVAITKPSTTTNYIRVKTQFAVRSSSSSQELIHCAWHHASGAVANPTYGWQTVGLDDDVANDITVINYTTDILVSNLLNLEGEETSAGSTVYLWLKANGSSTGTDMLLGRWWPSTISSTGTSSVGPLIVEVYELTVANRTFNPPTPE